MEDAVKAAYRLAQKGDAVLLSPACASFDLFSNYEDRGRQFKKQIRPIKLKWTNYIKGDKYIWAIAILLSLALYCFSIVQVVILHLHLNRVTPFHFY